MSSLFAICAAEPRRDWGTGRKAIYDNGFGKSTLVGEWVAGPGQSRWITSGAVQPGQVCEQLESKVRVAWLSLDEWDSDAGRFLAGLIAALQTMVASIGAGLLGALVSPQPPSAESILAALLNEIAAVPDDFFLVLDDYHVINSRPLYDALTALENDELIHQAPAIVGCRTPSALAHATTAGLGAARYSKAFGTKPKQDVTGGRSGSEKLA